MDGTLLRLVKDQWQSEYFVIRDGYFLRFRHSRSTKVRGKYELSKCTLIPSVAETQFDLQPPNKANISLRAESRKIRKRWEKELEKLCKSNELELDLEGKDSPAVVVDTNGIMLAVNKHLCELSGYTKEQMVRQNVAMLTPKSVAKKHDALIKRYVEGGKKRLVGKPRRLKLRTSEDTEVPVVLFLSELICNNGLYFMAVLEPDDVTSMEVNLNSMTTPAVCCDEYGTIVSVNHPVIELFGYAMDELVDANVKMLMPPAMRTVHDAYLERYRRGKGGKLIGQPRRVVAQRKDGSQIETLITIGELFQNGQRLVLGTFSEVVEVAHLEERADEGAQDSSDDEDLVDFTFSSSSSTSTSVVETPRGRYQTMENPHAVMSSMGPEYAAACQQVQSATVAAMVAEMRRLSARHAKEVSELRAALHSATQGSGGGPSAPNFHALDMSSLVIERRLAHCGGSGATVYSVLIEGWRCAMKELDISATNQRSIESFLKEISMCERLPYHPNICRYLFHARAGDRLRLFMTQYDGTLARELAKLRDAGKMLSPREIARYAQEILQGLGFLHAQRVLHRDLKSENVFAVYNGQGEVQSLAIGDFDQAKMGQAVTMVGTPGFTAPEVLREEGAYSFPADIWSFGMILYEMAALQQPYEGMGIMQMSKAMTQGPPAFPLDVRPELGPIGEVFAACTRMDPKERADVTALQSMLATAKY
eukprot:TRINITY_DN31_c0_g2_i10.p1 TRINITY_DN31_c0_g2~~TRINITY_DN31_c0_g2_i10.p1  ORF type:complete len:706 (-),score=241.35 TRINITY_DN31_c0_g2_i10:204-2321(-)